MWIMERVGVIPMMDSCVVEDGREKRVVSCGTGRVMGGEEWSVKIWSVEE